jgi:cellulose synthase/poly-beta-1,6-N-acetylglucosamine synthase-like glycosyltransferase
MNEEIVNIFYLLTKWCFWIAILSVLHSYLFFPFIIKIIAHLKKNIEPVLYSDEKDFPFLSIIVPAHNEIAVLSDKIQTILVSNYPSGKYEILIGSDYSTDGTDEQIEQLAAKYSCIKPYIFKHRQGKPAMLNQLVPQSKGSILIFSDANVMLDINTLKELACCFCDNRIGLVDTRMVNTGMTNAGISGAENTYISREVQIKLNESRAWGTMMGPFGGCFAMRRELFEEIPSSFTVDDFYLSMVVFEKGKLCINRPQAMVFEAVSNSSSEEYRRKVRISSGNFKNLARFAHLLWPPYSPIAFSWLSHKVLRWLGPFFYLIALLCSAILWTETSSMFYGIFFCTFIIVALIPMLDGLLRKIGVNIVILRLTNHFVYMNLALLHGFINYLKGIKTNVWEPTRRNQS